MAEVDEFGQLNLQPRPGRQWASRGGGGDERPRRWRRATYTRPHLSTIDDPRVGQWAAANNVELAYTPTNASWLNRIEAQFQALRYFILDGTDHTSHHEQAGMIRATSPGETAMPTTAGSAKSRTGQTLPDAPLADPRLSPTVAIWWSSENRMVPSTSPLAGRRQHEQRARHHFPREGHLACMTTFGTILDEPRRLKRISRSNG